MLLRTIRTIIIDDDKDWHDILKVLVDAHPKLELVGTYTSPIVAYNYIAQNEVDLILLDIEMPEINGLDFIKSMVKPPHVIFITAHPEFAVKSYEVNAVDYLVKPITAHRFLQAIEKVMLKWNDINALQTVNQEQFFFIRENNFFVKIDVNNVLFLRSMENYTQIVALDRTYTMLMSLSAVEEQLPPSVFQRVHRSYVVNISKITLINKTELYINDYKVPLTRTFADKIMANLVKSHLITK